MKKDKILFAVLVCIIGLMCGCAKTDGNVGTPTPPAVPSSVPKQPDTPTTVPEPTATPTPSPTPIVDVPKDRPETAPAADADRDNAELIQLDWLDGVLNPFDCESTEDCEIVTKTQLPLIFVDDAGEVHAGINYPCFAYEIRLMNGEGDDDYEVIAAFDSVPTPTPDPEEEADITEEDADEADTDAETDETAADEATVADETSETDETGEDGETGETEENAEPEEVPEVYRRYRIILKQGLTFADGTPITLDDVLYSIRTVTNPEYNGPVGICDLDIEGMEAYYTRVPADVRKTAETILDIGINEDGTYPESDLVTPEQQAEFWSCMDKAGINMTQAIIDRVNSKYAIDAYVQTFLSNNLTYSHIAADKNLQVAYAMAISGYMSSYKSSTNVFKDTFGVEYNLNDEELTVEDFWNVIFTYYGYNLDRETGLGYESVDRNKYFEDYLEEVYFADKLGVDSISGIIPGEIADDDGAVRPYIDVLIGNYSELSDFNFFVTEKEFYATRRNSKELHGAGEYVLVSFDGVTAELKANDLYLLGAPEQKYIIYTTEVITDEVDETDAGDDDTGA